MKDPDIRKRVSIARSTLPAITHVDYSARLQSVSEERNGRYYRLIRAFKERTGCSVLVNTSFNVRGEPIVQSPENALGCFLSTGMDVLVLENYILRKEDQPADLVQKYRGKGNPLHQINARFENLNRNPQPERGGKICLHPPFSPSGSRTYLDGYHLVVCAGPELLGADWFCRDGSPAVWVIPGFKEFGKNRLCDLAWIGGNCGMDDYLDLHPDHVLPDPRSHRTDYEIIREKALTHTI